MARRRYQKPEPYKQAYGKGSNRDEFWTIRFRVDEVQNGKIKRRARKVKLGRCSQMTKRLAERERDRILSTINGFDYKPTEQVTFGELAQRYVETVIPTREPGTRQMHAWHLEKFLVPFFGDYRIENVTLEAAQQLVASLTRSGGKDGIPMNYPSIRSVIGTLTGLFKVWRGWDYKCPEVRVSRLKLPAYVPMPKESKLYQPAEAQSIFFALDRETEFVCKLQTALCLRPSEILGLSKFDFDFENKFVCIQRKACSRTRELRVIKTKKPKVVALAPEVEKYVREWMASGYVENANGLLFRRKGNELPLVQKTLRRKLRKVQAALGFARRGMHGFRHTAASIAVHATGSEQAARTLLGHGDASRATATYVHMLGDDERLGAHAVAKELFGTTGKKKPARTQTLCPDVSGKKGKMLSA